MQPNAFATFLKQQATPAAPAVQHRLQLAGSTAQASLQPIQNQTVHALAGKLYLPQPTPYQPPINHQIIATHQASHQQSPATTNPDISSAYLLPVPSLNLGA